MYVATHDGLFRAGAGRRTLERVGDDHNDLMGFTVVGPGRFLASGHPSLDEDLPPLLGLIASADGGRSWESVSLQGRADFHVLRAAGDRVYGFDGASGQLLVSADRGRAWRARPVPAPLLDLAVDPERPDRLVAATEDGLLASSDAGATWRARGRAAPGLLAWDATGLTLVDARGMVLRSTDGGRTFARAGRLDEAPAALATTDDGLIAALGDGTVLTSEDGGTRWTTRATSAPPAS
jgi:photosystem II stability/assembly factor-like uncharacterized protein